MENQYFDKQLKNIIGILEHDYAGLALNDPPMDFRYYMQAAGMAWKEKRLDQLLFLRYVSQMLATSMDRSLRLFVISEDYRPWRAGFDARRVGDALYVTDVAEDKRLRAGDKIILLNGRTPGEHRTRFQKNFLYAIEPEREMWGNVLKMAERMTVEHIDGSREEIPIFHITDQRPTAETRITRPASGVIQVQVGALEDLERLVAQEQSVLDHAERLILDLRHAVGDDPGAFVSLTPYILSCEKTLNDAEGTQLFRTLCTKENCLRRLEQLEPYKDIPEAAQIISEFKSRFGAGWVTVPVRWWDDYPKPVQPRGHEVVILTDTWTEGATESFVRLAQKEGRARIIGRATMGNLDFTSIIHVRISGTAVLAYPISISDEAANGQGFRGRGIAPDRVIPFTPEECLSDVILNAALE